MVLINGTLPLISFVDNRANAYLYLCNFRNCSVNPTKNLIESNALFTGSDLFLSETGNARFTYGKGDRTLVVRVCHDIPCSTSTPYTLADSNLFLFPSMAKWRDGYVLHVQRDDEAGVRELLRFVCPRLNCTIINATILPNGQRTSTQLDQHENVFVLSHDTSQGSVRLDTHICRTSSPTLPPTGAPTNSPTQGPTNVPTISPTQGPTNVPTISPTQGPTYSPTPSPVNESKGVLSTLGTPFIFAYLAHAIWGAIL